MPLAGPRPDPTPSHLPPPTPYSQSHDPSYPSLNGPAFPSNPPSSELPYPHQSSPESGTTLLEPILDDDRHRTARNIRDTWARENGYNHAPSHNNGDEGNSKILHLDERDITGRSNYHDPYTSVSSRGLNSETDGVRAPSPSLGPWDSASQRSNPRSNIPPSSQTLFPIPHTSVPLNDTRSTSQLKHLRQKPSYTGGLSYIDEEGLYYKSDQPRPASIMTGHELEMRGLVGGAAGMGGGRGDGEEEVERERVKFKEYEESPYLYPRQGRSADDGYKSDAWWGVLLFPTGLDRLLGLFGVKWGKEPIAQAIERKRRGIGGQRWPVAAWGLAVVMSAVMVYELIKNNQETGTPIAIKPNFNYMIGPTAEVLINIGARFPPCMKYVEALPPTFQLACLNDTSNPPTSTCTIEEICGHGGFPTGTPDQSFRFILPIFLHVGVIHLALNMIAQITAGAQVEREMGTIPFLLVYFAGGIYGFVLGGNFSRTGIPSVGASGALFATNACVLVDLLSHWKHEDRPKLKAFLLAVEFLIGIAIGYIPNAVDGLAHLGGFAIGLLMGSILYPSISETRRHKLVVWGCRIVAIPLIILAFVLTIRNFYTADPNAACEWCRYLSCFPTASNGHCSGTGITTTNTTGTRRSWDGL